MVGPCLNIHLSHVPHLLPSGCHTILTQSPKDRNKRRLQVLPTIANCFLFIQSQRSPAVCTVPINCLMIGGHRFPLQQKWKVLKKNQKLPGLEASAALSLEIESVKHVIGTKHNINSYKLYLKYLQVNQKMLAFIEVPIFCAKKLVIQFLKYCLDFSSNMKGNNDTSQDWKNGLSSYFQIL